MSRNDLIIQDRKVGEDINGFLSLTDIWKIAGSPSTKTTANWRQLPTTDEYIRAVAENLGKSYVKGENRADSVVYSKAGRGGGTFAHVFVALAYGEYLSADLAVEIKKTYQRVRTGDLTLVDEILAKADAARHHNEVRDLSKEVRKKYADTLTSHGAGGGAIGCQTVRLTDE